LVLVLGGERIFSSPTKPPDLLRLGPSADHLLPPSDEAKDDGHYIPLSHINSWRDQTILPLLLHLLCSILGALDSATEDAGGFFLGSDRKIHTYSPVLFCTE